MGKVQRLSGQALSPDGLMLNSPRSPLIPAQAGIQHFWLWVPAFAGTNGVVLSKARLRRHSASGWFSGRALSNAGSLRQAVSAATIFGNASSGTLSRRALNTC